AQKQAQFYTRSGCSHCLNTGYYGRTGIFELLTVDERIKELITRQTAAHTIKKAAVEKGMRTLRDNGIRQALGGITTLAEVLRVTQDKIELDIGKTEHVGI
ncbi:MAG: hypothetical protein KAT56_04935, partial [Sedimentisphaerales bacterium]|nr:hypothetical protein [Sedimentisphaerales bacterium]